MQLILDMKVRWSSTYMMLDRAERKKAVGSKSRLSICIHCSFFVQCVDAFVDELKWEETDLAKRDKIREQKLTSEEWERVHLFLGLLSVRLPVLHTKLGLT
jgi:hypothetical protein